MLVARHLLHDFSHYLICSDVLRFGLEIENDPVSQRREENILDVFVADVNSTVSQRMEFCSQDDRLRSTRARTEAQVLPHR